ncbi:hypothetical protein [uncultured Aquimarina sp.]|uniref:hypothetical protein n=1 Tax=uncultured Aquimarina sp. TaxID=575652 RepID=UPI002638AF6B|nr:hypothetical protein [uncultured Aquimarina sp.]
MKEENLKKLISKSTVETSNDFINNLMNAIEAQKETKKMSFRFSFKMVLLVCSTLTLILSGLLFNILGKESRLFDSLTEDIPKTPVFLVITLTLLYYINSIIRLNYYNTKK